MCFFTFFLINIYISHISFCWTSTVTLLPNRLMINDKISYRGARSSAYSQSCHILLVTRPSFHIAYNFAKSAPKDNIFHVDIVTLENISRCFLLSLKSGMPLYSKQGWLVTTLSKMLSVSEIVKLCEEK